MISFLRSFLNRGGGWFLLANVFSKAVFILSPLWLVRVMPFDEFGALEYVKSVVFILVPFFGAGLHEYVLYKGATLKSERERKDLFVLLLPVSLAGSSFLFLILAIIFYFFRESDVAGQSYIALLFYPITQGLMLIYTNYLRVGENKRAYTLCICSSALFFMAVTMLSGGDAIIVAMGIAAAPLFGVGVTYLINFAVLRYVEPTLKAALNSKNRSTGKLIQLGDGLKYGLLVGLGGVVSQLGLLADIVLLGLITEDPEVVGIYRMLTILPSMILFLPSVMIKSDFVHLARLQEGGVYLYYIDYIKSFLKAMFFPLLGFVLMSELIIKYVYGVDFNNQVFWAQVILLVACVFSCISRIPLGGILYALGHVKVNTLNAFLAVAINISLGAALIPACGLVGAALGTFFSVLVTSALQVVFFRKLLKRDKV
ncbi:hypothetical protein ASALC70_04081 [Alcanivorax sp. ALC70]|nr:hypothetical protein ASALC70_04081 [Alcanivorax sp. ALC70]